MEAFKNREKGPADVVVAMSGGVDSALSAALLNDRGYEVTGLHFLLPSTPEIRAYRLTQVRKLAGLLKISLAVLELEAGFKKMIIDPFIEAYLRGFTPNPCVLCNEIIKLDHLLQFADDREIEYVATGHYARVAKDQENGKALLRGVDRNKDQSYFLHRLRPIHLQRLILPLGEMTKDRVRQTAREKGLPNYSQPGSQEICFIPDNDYRAFVEAEKGLEIQAAGDIVDRSGQVLGRHQGIHRYTIGQRHGLGIASARPYYVLGLDPLENRVMVGRKEELYRDYVEADDFNWIKGAPVSGAPKTLAQIRYRHKATPGRLRILSETRVRFEFEIPQPAVTPGQALVCYDGDRVLGGGWIREGE